MNEKVDELLREMQEDVTVPAVVQQKVQATLDQIREQDSAGISRKKKRWNKKKVFIFIAAALITVGTVSVAAAIEKGVLGIFSFTPEQKDKLKDDHYLAEVGQSITSDDGITATLEECVADGRCAYVSYRIEGIPVPDDPYSMPSDFQPLKIIIEGTDLSSDMTWNCSYAPVSYTIDNDGTQIPKYVREDGSREVVANLENGNYIGKEIIATFQTGDSLSENTQQAEMPTIKWLIEGSEVDRHVDINKPFGEREDKMESVDISPVSLKMTGSFYMTEQKDSGVVNPETGQIVLTPFSYYITSFAGLKMKDGSAIIVNSRSFLQKTSDISLPQEERYTDPGTSVTIPFDQVIDVDQIDSLLFYKQYLEDGVDSQEDYDMEKTTDMKAYSDENGKIYVSDDFYNVVPLE